MSDGKVPMPASGQDSPKLHSDGVSDVAAGGRTGGGQSGGGSYQEPNIGSDGDFDGGQSVKGHYGSGELDGKTIAKDKDEAERNDD